MSMTMASITSFRKNVFEFISNAIKYNDPVFITTKDGNAVVLSEDEYNSMLATLELVGVPGMPERLKEAAAAPDDAFVNAEDIGW